MDLKRIIEMERKGEVIEIPCLGKISVSDILSMDRRRLEYVYREIVKKMGELEYLIRMSESEDENVSNMKEKLYDFECLVDFIRIIIDVEENIEFERKRNEIIGKVNELLKKKGYVWIERIVGHETNVLDYEPNFRDWMVSWIEKLEIENLLRMNISKRCLSQEDYEYLLHITFLNPGEFDVEKIYGLKCYFVHGNEKKEKYFEVLLYKVILKELENKTLE